MYSFDSESGRLLVERADGLKFDLSLRKYVTVIHGDSATSKTMLCNLIEEYNVRQAERPAQVLNYKDIGRLNRLDLVYDKTVKLLIIDNADAVLAGKKEMVDYISGLEHTMQFLIFSRCIDFKRTSNYFGTFVMEQPDVVQIKYRTSVAGWFQ